MAKSPQRRDTKGAEKLKNYFERVVDSDDFRNGIALLRKRFYIPPNGFTNPPENFFMLDRPKEWKYFHKPKMMGVAWYALEKLCNKKELRSHWLKNAAWKYLFYNELGIGGENSDLCTLLDLVGEKKLFGLNLPEFAEEYQLSENKADLEYPIAIKISPYASLRDILDFAKGKSMEIAEIQLKYKKEGIKIGRVKTRDAQRKKRDRRVFELRELPQKKIASIVNKEFGGGLLVGYGDIGKIISIERRRRKDM